MSVCSKAKQILGLLYRRFYNHAEGATLKQLYLSLIRPHLEYACPVWDLHTMKDKVLLEDVQKCAFRMATKQWDSGYQELLDIMNVPSLADRRLQLKLALFYKIVHGMCYFPSDILCPRTNYSLRTNHSLVIDHILMLAQMLILLLLCTTHNFCMEFTAPTTCNCSICFCFQILL